MELTLHPHQSYTYGAAAHLLTRKERATVIHSAGAGKNNIIFKLIEAAFLCEYVQRGDGDLAPAYGFAYYRQAADRAGPDGRQAVHAAESQHGEHDGKAV